MKNPHSFTNAYNQYKPSKPRKKVRFFEEANQNVQNIISDILLTIDEEDKSHSNITEKLQKLQREKTTKVSKFKTRVKRVKSSKRITRRKSIAPVNTKLNNNYYQTYLCTNQNDFFKQLANVVEEESSQSSSDKSSIHNIRVNKSTKTVHSSKDLTEVIKSEDNSIRNNHTSKITSAFLDSGHDLNNNNNNDSSNYVRFPSKKQKHTDPIVITRCDSSPYNNIKQNDKPRFSITVNDNNFLNFGGNNNNNNTSSYSSFKNNSSLAISSSSLFNNKKQKDFKKLNNDHLTYDSNILGSHSVVIKGKKEVSSPITPEHSSPEEYSDENKDDDWFKRRKSYCNYDRLTRQSKVRNIEKQIRESFNIQQKKKQLRESVGQQLNVKVLPQEIEREFDNFVIESNDEIYKYQTLCSELRINMMNGIRQPQKETPNEDGNVECTLEQLQNIKENETSYDIEISPSGSKTCKSNILLAHDNAKSPLSNFSSRSAVAAIILNKEEKEFEQIKEKKKIINKTFTQIQRENELEEQKQKEALRLKETNYRVLFRKNNPIYDSLSDQEIEDDLLELDHFYIKPDSILRKLLDGSVAIFAFLFLYFIPIEIAFIHTWGHKLKYFIFLYILGETTFIIDFILSFFMAYFDMHDNLITQKDQIRLNYICSWCLFDFITALPTNTLINGIFILKDNYYDMLHSITFTNSQIRFVHLLKLLKTFKILKICFNNYCVQSIINHVLFSKKGKSLLLYVTLIAFITSLHILTCLFIFFGFSNYPNWILQQNFHPTEYGAIYIAGIYFLEVTIVGVGYGDILGTNQMEKLYLIFLLVIGVLLYSWVVSTLSKIKNADAVIAISEKAQEIKEKIIQLETIRQSYPDMTFECYKRIQRYLNYNYHKEMFSPKMIFDNLPLHLQRDLIFNMYKPVIENFVFFKYFKNEDFIMKVLMCFQPNICIKNERIVNRGDFMDEMLFVRSGKLAIELPLPNEITSQLMETKERKLTQYFNEYKLTGIATRIDSLTEHNKHEHEHEHEHKETEQIQYVKLLEIHKNEHYGDIVMFLNKRSPLGVRVCTRKAELFYLKKADAISISMSFPSIWKKLITNSLFNMKQISSLIKKTLNFFYMNNKKILQKLILQNESYFDNMKNTQINVNPPEGVDMKEMDIELNKEENSVNGNDDNKERKETFTSESILKTHIISESSNCLLINNSEEGLLAHEEQKGNLRLNNIQHNSSNINVINNNHNNNNDLHFSTSSLYGGSTLSSPNIKSKFLPKNKQISSNQMDTNIIKLQPIVPSIHINNNDNIISPHKNKNRNSLGNILDKNTFQLQHRESITKQQNLLSIIKKTATNPNLHSKNRSPNLLSQRSNNQHSMRSNVSSAISSLSSSEDNSNVSPKFIFDSEKTPSFNPNQALIINNELYNGESLLQNNKNIPKLKNPPLVSESFIEEDNSPQHNKNNSKQPNFICSSNSIKPSSIFTEKIIDEFKRNVSNKDVIRSSIRERTASSKNPKGKKLMFGITNPMINQGNGNGTMIGNVKEDKKKKGTVNFFSQSHLPIFDPFLNKVNYTPTLGRRRLVNKRGTTTQQIRLETIQNNIEQNQLNLKNPQMFYSEAFKEMINSKEKKNNISNLNKQLRENIENV